MPSAVIHNSRPGPGSSARSVAPSLSDGSLSPGSSSVDTQLVADMEVINILESDAEGNLIAPSGSHSILPHATTVYHCLFHTLLCDFQHRHVDVWKKHVLSHFRGRPFYPHAVCPWCARDYYSPQISPERAWNDMLDHVAHDHFERGHSLAATRVSFELMQYLYRNKLITDDQLRTIQLVPAPDSPAYHPLQEPVRASVGSANEPFCSLYSPRRERRMRAERRECGMT
ncbi:hypothetical protein VTN49DRAFT_3493 [Thermomyces lanuginosus]|uniref:uncharacterized protein n=1 Tax=Thermomyces lanuginosus TaxID=5541 RepID=UPI003743ADDD